MTELLKVPGLEALRLDALDPILHPLILALPVFVLATLIAILARLLRARRRRLAAAREAAPLTLTSAQAANQPVAAAPAAPPRAAVPSPVAEPAQPNATDPIASLQSKIDAAMKVQPNSTLAPMFLEMARHHKAAGNESSYLAALRSAAGLAAQHGPRASHADARLQLAEAAFVAGDLTGACEQWQIARDALRDDGQKDAHARVDQRMRDNGCPTDWVLTDF